jgi:hypothetical protein
MAVRFRPSSSPLLAALVVTTLAVGASPAGALHDPDVSADESRCQGKTSVIAWRFFAKKGKCVMACQRDARAGNGDIADCVPPYAGSTQGCVNGLEGKTTASVCKVCTNDLPECFGSPQNCPDLADDKVAVMEAELDALMADVYCDDSGSGDGLTALEAKCQDVLTKYLGYFASRKATCLYRCRSMEHKGSVPAGSCTAGAITDPTGKTQACLTAANDKTVAKIDKGCSALLGAEAPECHGGSAAQDWIDGVEQSVDDQDPSFFCGSPSGAFLD